MKRHRGQKIVERISDSFTAMQADLAMAEDMLNDAVDQTEDQRDKVLLKNQRLRSKVYCFFDDCMRLVVKVQNYTFGSVMRRLQARAYRKAEELDAKRDALCADIQKSVALREKLRKVQ